MELFYLNNLRKGPIHDQDTLEIGKTENNSDGSGYSNITFFMYSDI